MSFNKSQEECVNELNIDNSAIDRLENYLFPEDNQDIKNLLVCIWKKEKIIDSNDNIVMDNLKVYLLNYFQESQNSTYWVAILGTADTINSCGNISEKTVHDTVVKISNCVLRKIDSY